MKSLIIFCTALFALSSVASELTRQAKKTSKESVTSKSNKSKKSKPSYLLADGTQDCVRDPKDRDENGKPRCVEDRHNEIRAFRKLEGAAYVLKRTIDKAELAIERGDKNEDICADVMTIKKLSQNLCNYYVGPGPAADGGCDDPNWKSIRKDLDHNYLSGDEDWNEYIRATNVMVRELDTNTSFCPSDNPQGANQSSKADIEAFRALEDRAEMITDFAMYRLRAIDDGRN